MGRETEIAWTATYYKEGVSVPVWEPGVVEVKGATFNSHWGCVKVSPACEHCYALTFSKRVGMDIWGVDAARRTFGAKHWQEPYTWNASAMKAGVRRKVFCASMSDVFEGRDDLDPVRKQLWETIENTRALDWLLLTKRPENILSMIPVAWRYEFPQNVWVGTSVEDQKWAEKRIPALLEVPAPVRFLSCEPLLGEIDLMRWLDNEKGVNWCIVGGESGAGHRTMNLEWARSLRDQCAIRGVPFFMKQDSGKHSGLYDHLPDDLKVRAFPVLHRVAA